MMPVPGQRLITSPRTVLVPALPGCVTYGQTIDEALRMAEEAIHCHLLGLADLYYDDPRFRANFAARPAFRGGFR